jgi:hypothetical protein
MSGILGGSLHSMWLMGMWNSKSLSSIQEGDESDLLYRVKHVEGIT